MSAALLLGALGCASRSPGGSDAVFSAAPNDSTLTWPSPPDPPRIKYVRSFSRPGDVGIGKSVFRRIVDAVAGGSDQRIRQPSAVAVDSAGRIYVADVVARGVHVFDLEHGRYQLIARIGGTNLRWPVSVALDPAGGMYISDSEARIVFALDAKGRERFRITTGMRRPTGIAFDAADQRLYVVDTDAHCLRVFDRDGRPIATFGERGVGAGQFNFPVHVSIGADRRLYVTDAMNTRVVRLDRDGRFLSAFGGRGDAVGDLPRPKATALDSEGHVFVVEGLYDVVNVYDTAGRLLLTFGQPGHRPGEFWLATGIAVDGRDRIYVTDSFNGRVQVFQYVAHAE